MQLAPSQKIGGVFDPIGGASKPIRQLATRSRHPNNTATFGATNQVMSRSRHIARTTITRAAIVIPTWWVKHQDLAEHALGGTATVTAAFEYNGTFTQITFGGSATGVLPDNTNNVSDMMSVSIPAGAAFFVRIFWQSAAGFLNNSPAALGVASIYNGGRDELNGERFKQAASGLTDQTMGGTITSTNTVGDAGFCPAAIIGPSNTPAIFLLGDSRVEGALDFFNDASTDTGQLARSIGPYFPYINDGVHSQSTPNYIAQSTKQRELAQWCSHIVYELGINNFPARTPAQSVSDAQSILGMQYLAGKPAFLCTLTPVTTSTDAFSTTANQTVSTKEAQRTAYNDLLRAGGIAGVSGFLEFADVAEITRNSGKWRVDTITSQFTATIATKTMTVSAVASGALTANTAISEVGGLAAQQIQTFGTGTGGTGTYNMALTNTIGSATTMFCNPPTSDGIHECPPMNMLFNTGGVFNPAIIV
jgi:hypothetical protein